MAERQGEKVNIRRGGEQVVGEGAVLKKVERSDKVYMNEEQRKTVI